MNSRWKWTVWRAVAAVILLSGAVAAVRRFTLGLGAVTDLSDGFPWGIWVSFDVMCGVGLAGGGFTISAMVYLFGRERYRSLARPAIFTAFIGYLMVVGGLIFDLGHPWRIWHPMVMWNHHSVMFEVAWCVTLYTTVLAAEVSTMVFERLKMVRSAHIAHNLAVPLTMLAVLLSMLHQSSLGSLFLLVPGRLHALWYTPLLPFLFFLSAIGVGLSMTIVESNLTSRSMGRAVEAQVLRSVARVAAGVYALYVLLRLGDLVWRGQLGALWPVDRAAAFFLLEFACGFVLPLALYARTRVRRNSRWLYHTAQLAVLGFLFNRLNVGITGFEVVSGVRYTPTWEEMSITLSLVTVGVILFALAIRYLPVLEEEKSLAPAFAERQQSQRSLEPAAIRGG
ncbi:Ni/Fe-hydrogenase cytochrome b subunit [bacterium]|nr:MAG: Ni/Fe-hydrogenase cytochrome b subunit [bacterium]